MTDEERRLRPEHHIVHDYANLVSSGRLRETWKYGGVNLQTLGPVTGHVWHAFYVNCRKMYEFFMVKPNARNRHLWANPFTHTAVTFSFDHWNTDIQNHMNVHLLHVGDDRVENKRVWTGKDDMKYLADFEGAWKMFMQNLKEKHKDIFREEIDHRLTEKAFQHCGTLGKEFIL